MNELTPAEKLVYGQLALGFRPMEAAERLSRSPSTVKFHTHKIYHKLGVASQPELMARHYLGEKQFTESRRAA